MKQPFIVSPSSVRQESLVIKQSQPAADGSRFSVFRYQGTAMLQRVDDLTEIEVNEAVRHFTKKARTDFEQIARNRQALLTNARAVGVR